MVDLHEQDPGFEADRVEHYGVPIVAEIKDTPDSDVDTASLHLIISQDNFWDSIASTHEKIQRGSFIEDYVFEDGLHRAYSDLQSHDAIGLIELNHDEEGDLFYEQETRYVDLREGGEAIDNLLDILADSASDEGHKLLGNKHNFIDELAARMVYFPDNPLMRELREKMVQRESSFHRFLAHVDIAAVANGTQPQSLIIETMERTDELTDVPVEDSHLNSYPGNYSPEFRSPTYTATVGTQVLRHIDRNEEYSISDRYLAQEFFSDTRKWSSREFNLIDEYRSRAMEMLDDALDDVESSRVTQPSLYDFYDIRE